MTATTLYAAIFITVHILLSLLLEFSSHIFLHNQYSLFVFHIFAAMGKFMKSGKVVLVLGGRFAGRKAVIVKVGDFKCMSFHALAECK